MHCLASLEEKAELMRLREIPEGEAFTPIQS